jgi:hypothetical protein
MTLRIRHPSPSNEIDALRVYSIRSDFGFNIISLRNCSSKHVVPSALSKTVQLCSSRWLQKQLPIALALISFRETQTEEFECKRENCLTTWNFKNSTCWSTTYWLQYWWSFWRLGQDEQSVLAATKLVHIWKISAIVLSTYLSFSQASSSGQREPSTKSESQRILENFLNERDEATIRSTWNTAKKNGNIGPKTFLR